VIRIRVERGDISSFQGDGVVNAANNHLRMGAGVAGALLRRGGPLIQQECDDYVRAHGPLEVGEAALTGGGALSARWVIHAAAMGDTPPTAESIRSSTRHSLRIATEKGLRSVAFPILGTGIGGFPFGKAARLMVAEIRAHAGTTALPEDVVLYAFEEDRAAELRRVLEER